VLLDDLVDLARDASPERRQELLRALSNMFVENAATCGTRERHLFDDIMCRVVDHVEVEARAELSEKLGGHAAAPRETVLKLAGDEAAVVARPVLENSPVLTTADLVGIAETRSDAHLEAIAKRTSLREEITDVLVRRGSSLVVATVAGNLGAKFSEEGFGELGRRAMSDETLQLKLLARQDVPEDVAKEVLPFLSAELRARVGAGDTGDLPEEIVERLRARLGATMRERDRETRQLSALIEDVRARRRSLDETVIDIAQQDRLADIAELFTAFGGVDLKTALAALTGTNPEPLQVLMRAMALDALTLTAVMQLRSKRLRLPYRHDPKAVERYLAIEPATAQRALRFHKVRSSVAA